MRPLLRWEMARNDVTRSFDCRFATHCSHRWRGYYHPMNRGSVIVSAKLAISLLSASLVQWSVPAQASTVTTEKAACDVTKARVAARDHFPVSAIAFCDVVVPEAQPKGFYVLGLHGKRNDCGDKVCGSTLMGWFAVQKATGQVFEWDMVEDALGQPVKAPHK